MEALLYIPPIISDREWTSVASCRATTPWPRADQFVLHIGRTISDVAKTARRPSMDSKKNLACPKKKYITLWRNAAAIERRQSIEFSLRRRPLTLLGSSSARMCTPRYSIVRSVSQCWLSIKKSLQIPETRRLLDHVMKMHPSFSGSWIKIYK